MASGNYESPVATAPTEATARALAGQMSAYSIGCIVIVDEQRRPLGIVTDRDLLTRVVAEGLDPDATRAGEVMSKPVAAASADEPIEALVERMAQAGVRRLPVLEDGRLSGIVALDDLLVWLARELDDLSEATRSEITEGFTRARKERKRADLEERFRELRNTVVSAGEEAVELTSKELERLRERLARLLGRSDPERDAKRRDGHRRGGP